MGALETGGAVATSTIDALKSQPMTLALIVINIVFLLGTGFTLFKIMDRVQDANIRHDTMLTNILRDDPKDPWAKFRLGCSQDGSDWIILNEKVPP